MDNRQDYFMNDEWDGYQVKITCSANRSCLDLSGGNSSNGTIVQGWDDNGSTSQRWVLQKITRGASWSPWAIKSVISGNYLDLDNGNNSDGAKVQCWSQSWADVCRNKNSQWFIITQQEGDAKLFRLQNARSFTSVDLFAGQNQKPVYGWHRMDYGNQLWWFERA